MNAAVIVAGGDGERSGLGGGKQLALVAGVPVLSHTLRAFEECDAIDAVIVVTHPERVDEYRALAIEPAGCAKVTAVVPGGQLRQRSVRAGLDALPGGVSVVAIHDGARPLVTAEAITSVIDALLADTTLDGAVLGHPSYDTLKQVDPTDRVMRTVDRTEFWIAQTPQVFRVGALLRAYAHAEATGFEGTDDAAVVEHAGGAIRMVLGQRDNIKITVPGDLAVVERILAAREVGESRE